jgi:ElaA protein
MLKGRIMEFFAKTFNQLTTSEVYEILKSRSQIFVIEQKIVYLDMDDIDYDSLHCFIKDGNSVIACLRAYYCNKEKTKVKIGRVLTTSHGKGIGKLLMENSIGAIRQHYGCDKIYINSQKHAVGFYQKSGFKVTSDEFIEAGIPHISMELEL